MTTNYVYVGQELEIFANARNWKAYWAEKISPYIGDRVLEVGAGIGANTAVLVSSRQTEWICLEPDASLVNILEDRIQHTLKHPALQVRCGTTREIKASGTFDTVLYLDVLEHIEDDQNELERAASLLRPGGTLIVLAPAHQWLYSPFDKSIGHFRRYTEKSLIASAPKSLNIERSFYLDAAGLLLSAANRFILKQSTPSEEQIRFWDRCIVPISRYLDRFLYFRCGKTIVCIWRRL